VDHSKKEKLNCSRFKVWQNDEGCYGEGNRRQEFKRNIQKKVTHDGRVPFLYVMFKK